PTRRSSDLIGDLEGVALCLVVEAGRYQVERTDARVLDVYGLKNVAQRKCVAGRQLIIDSRADGDPSLWNRKDLSKRIDDGKRIGIKRRSVDDRTIIDRRGIGRDEERCSGAERPFQTAPVFVKPKWRFLGGIGVSRIPEAVAEIGRASCREREYNEVEGA